MQFHLLWGFVSLYIQQPNLFGILLTKQKAAKEAVIEVTATK